MTGGIAMFLLVRMAVGAETPDAGRFLDTLEAFQEQVKNIELDVSSDWWAIERATGDRKATPYYDKIHLIIDASGKRRLRIDREEMLPWIAGGGEEPASDRALTRRSEGYDGKIARKLEINVSLSGGAETVRKQTITSERPDVAFLEHDAGLNLIASIYKGKGLAQYLRELDPGRWQLEADGGDVYTVRELLPGDEWYHEVTVDFTKGGAIVKDRNVYKNGTLVSQQLNIVLGEVSPGVWLPAAVEEIRPSRYRKIVFSTIKINQDLPDEKFLVDFMPGHQVYDTISGNKYVLGAKSSEELDEFIGKAVDEALSVTDRGPEKRPVEIGAGATEETQSYPTTTRWRTVILIALVAALALCGAALARRARRNRTRQ